jgi:hypothetical protein
MFLQKVYDKGTFWLFFTVLGLPTHKFYTEHSCYVTVAVVHNYPFYVVNGYIIECFALVFAKWAFCVFIFAIVSDFHSYPPSEILGLKEEASHLSLIILYSAYRGLFATFFCICLLSAILFLSLSLFISFCLCFSSSVMYFNGAPLGFRAILLVMSISPISLRVAK